MIKESEILHDKDGVIGGDSGQREKNKPLPLSEVIQKIIRNYRVKFGIGIDIRRALDDGFTREQLAATVDYLKEKLVVIRTQEEGEMYLNKYCEKCIDKFEDYIGEWELLKDKIHEFETSPKMTELLPLEIQHFADHDGDKLRADLEGLSVKIKERCDRLMQPMYLHSEEGEEQSLVAEIRDLLATLKLVWSLYEDVMGDILLRIDGTIRDADGKVVEVIIPEKDRKGKFKMSDVLGPIAVHSEHVAKYYESLGGGKKEIVFDLNGLGEEEIGVNKKVIVNLINNVINNAFYFARKKIILKLSRGSDSKKLVVSIINDGVPVKTDKNESGRRAGRLEIYNERFSTKDTKGLGISDADTRLESMDSSIEVRNNQQVGGKEFNGFEIIVPLIEK